MKIYSYENPYKLTDASFWPEIKSYAHLCVSQTLVQGLVQGLNDKCSRDKFWIINTIDAFLEQFYEDWYNNAENDIKRYVALSEEISKIENIVHRRTFKFNQRLLMDSIKFFMELKLDDKAFDLSELSSEQQTFLSIVRNLKNTEAWGSCFQELEELDIDSVKYSLFKLLKLEYDKLKLKDSQDVDPNTIAYLEQLVNDFSTNSTSVKLRGIVFHGVHQFTPLVLKLIRQLEKMSIEVVFLINYVERYPKIYETWHSVYEWTNLPILQDEGEHKGNFIKSQLGEAFAGLLEGEFPQHNFKNQVEVLKFENLTTFSDYVKEIFIRAKKNIALGRSSNVLARMKEQFYATENSRLSEMLKAYFPDQFGEKHFLSYPIGQFILALYNMWDEKDLTLKINDSLMKECLSVNFFHRSDMPNPVEIYNKLSLYFKDIQTISALLERLHKLMDIVRELEINKEHPDQQLRAFSFYQIPRKELAYFIDVIHDIHKITRELFDHHQDGKLNYKSHFQKLIDIISTRALVNSSSEKEAEIVEEIKKKFESIHDLQIEGSIEDLKETIHFYLNKNKYRVSQEETASWIVRNFEQLDGGVLLSRSKRGGNHTYHLAMVSDRKMKVKLNDLLPWPMNDQFFKGYTKQLGSDLNIVLKSLKEYSSFLRYSFFYATYYLKNKIVISYVEELDGEKESLYFILRLLGITCESRDDTLPGEINVGKKDTTSSTQPIKIEKLSVTEAQTFSICPYRYVLDYVLENGGSFMNEHHCRLYFRSILVHKCRPLISQINMKLIREVVHTQIQHYRNCNYFPFWRDIDFHDLESWAVKDLIKLPDYRYINLRLNFLVAEIKDSEEGENLVYDALHRIRHVRDAERISPKVREYLMDDTYLFNKDTVHQKICDLCKNRELCLHHFTIAGEDGDDA